MNSEIYSPLQIREVFHLEFLRRLGRKLEADRCVLKGGVNLRLFFKSIRYSEDMDIDLTGVRIEKIKKTVMEILAARGFSDGLKSFGIERIVPPDLAKAKQTETTQRFKIHLLTFGGEDLFTKIEFSRRGVKGVSTVEPVSAEILRAYKMAPLLVPHYDAASAIQQKIQAPAERSVLQARDIFDLFALSSQYEAAGRDEIQASRAVLKTAYDNIFLVEYPRFRDTVVAYLGAEDQKAYSSPEVWDEIKLKTAHFLEEFKHEKNSRRAASPPAGSGSQAKPRDKAEPRNIMVFIKKAGRRVFTTHEIAALSGKSASTVVQSLNRLVAQGLLVKIYRGVWAEPGPRAISSFEVIPYLFPRRRVYVSFITALHLHGIVEQIPQVITLVSTAHTSALRTQAGIFSVHQIAPAFFSGFDWYRGEGNFLIAEPEKALIDSLYLSSRKKKQFGHFPELHFPPEFSFKKAEHWVKQIPEEKIRLYVFEKLKALKNQFDHRN